jgi:hypothetical protein
LLFSAGSKIKGGCRLGTQAAMIRHLVVEKISLTPDLPYKPGATGKCIVKNIHLLLPFQRQFKPPRAA